MFLCCVSQDYLRSVLTAIRNADRSSALQYHVIPATKPTDTYASLVLDTMVVEELLQYYKRGFNRKIAMQHHVSDTSFTADMTGPRLVVHPQRGFRVDERRSEARGRQIAERAVVASGDCKRHTSRCTGQDTGLVVVAAFDAAALPTG